MKYQLLFLCFVFCNVSNISNTLILFVQSQTMSEVSSKEAFRFYCIKQADTLGACKRLWHNCPTTHSHQILCDYCIIWAASSEFGTYRLCEQRRFRRACASAQSRQNLRCSLIQAVSQEESSDRKPNP